MDTEKEFERIQRKLQNAEGWQDISRSCRTGVEQEFKVLFTLIESQQQAIEAYKKEFAFEHGWQKRNVANNKQSQWQKGALRGFDHAEEIFDKHFGTTQKPPILEDNQLVEAIKEKEKNLQIMTKEDRLSIINQLIGFIAKHGRRFFYCFSKNQTAYMKIEDNLVYFVDDYTGLPVLIDKAQKDEKDGFSHGGTLWALVHEFAEFIYTGQNTNGNGGYGGLYNDGWGHGDETQRTIIRYAKEIGYLKK